MLHSIQRHRERYAGVLTALIGLGAIVESATYGLGTLAAIGPGAFPLAMGVILVACGLGIGLSEATTADAHDHDRVDLSRPEWRGWACIVGGMLAFILLGPYRRLVPGDVRLRLHRGDGRPHDDGARRLPPRDPDRGVRLRPVLLRACTSSCRCWRGDSHDRHGAHRSRPRLRGRPPAGTTSCACFVGVLIGNIVGVLPGMGVMAAISILLPLTFAHAAGRRDPDAVPASIYGAQYGGAICSILLNLPCHPPHAVTCLDGYPLTSRARAARRSASRCWRPSSAPRSAS